MLIESAGPCWFYGTGSEHAVLYQYQLNKAKNVSSNVSNSTLSNSSLWLITLQIYMGHLQTEAPYFQPVPVSPSPFNSSLGLFPADPTFSDCTTDSCRVGWGVRLIDSSDIYIHGLGLYSWFSNFGQDCVTKENCQQRILDIKGSKNVALYNLFTKGTVEAGSGGFG